MNIIGISCLIIAVILINQIDAACICADGGSSLCNCNPSYVRPKPKPEVLPESKTICKTVGAKELKPIGDVCSCGEVHVSPSKEKCTGNSGCSCSRCSQKYTTGFETDHEVQRDFVGTQYDFATDVYEEKNAKKNPDGVSIVLAYEQLEKCNKHVPESKLHYGHIGKVRDGYVLREKQDLKDGMIYQVIGHPLSLRRCNKHRIEDEVEDVDDEEVYEEPHPITYTYEDIGYKPHKYQQRTYVKHYAPEKSYQCKDRSHSKYLHSRKTCTCKTCSSVVKDSEPSHYAYELLSK